MGSNLAKTPLIAICYAALLHFFAVFLPYSQGYLEGTSEFVMPAWGYLFLIGYCLWVTIAVSLVFAAVQKKDAKLFLCLFISMLGCQWLAPMLPRFFFPEPTGTLSITDGWLQFALGGGCTVLLLVLSALLLRTGAPPPPGQPQPKITYKLRIWLFIVLLLALPLVFFIAYLLFWYFMSWRSEAFRLYYGFEGNENGFISTMIDMLLGYARMVPMAFLLGFFYELITLPLLALMPGKKILYFVTTAMLYLSFPLSLLLPNAVIPDAVRSISIWQWVPLLVLYAAAVGFLLPLALRKIEIAPPPKAAPNSNPQAAARPGARPGAQPARGR